MFDPAQTDKKKIVAIFAGILFISAAGIIFIRREMANLNQIRVIPTPPATIITPNFVKSSPVKILANSVTSDDYKVARGKPAPCQPEDFDPEAANLHKVISSGSPGRLYEFTGMKLGENLNINGWNKEGENEYKLISPYSLTQYKFGCGSSFSSSLSVKENRQRTWLFNHVAEFASSGDGKYLYVNNNIEIDKDNWENRRRLLNIKTNSDIKLPNIDCVEKGFFDNDILITYSDINKHIKGFSATDEGKYLTEICIFDNQGRLLHSLEASLPYISASVEVLDAQIGLLPKDKDIFYAYFAPDRQKYTACELIYQNLKEQNVFRSAGFFISLENTKCGFQKIYLDNLTYTSDVSGEFIFSGINKTPSSIIYNSLTGIKKFNPDHKDEFPLSGKPGVSFLWSKNGQLAVTMQGKYGSDNSFPVKKAFATTEGFHYQLYLIDINQNAPRLILPEIYSPIFWDEKGEGFYFYEKIKDNKPLLLGDQSGTIEDETRYYHIDEDGKSNKRLLNKEDFENAQIYSLGTKSPDGKYILYDGGYLAMRYDHILNTQTRTKTPVKTDDDEKSFKSRWSPTGQKIAYLTKKENESKISLKVINSLDFQEQINSPELSSSMASEFIDYQWIDEENILILKLNYVASPGYYQGNIGIFRPADNSFKLIIPSLLQEVPFENTLLLSPDKKTFVYQISNYGENNGSLTQSVILADLNGNIIKKLNGRDPSWKPSTDLLNEAEAIEVAANLKEVKSFTNSFTGPNQTNPRTGGTFRITVEKKYKDTYLIRVAEETESDVTTFGWYRVNRLTREIIREN